MKTMLFPRYAEMVERNYQKPCGVISRMGFVLFLWCVICPDALSQSLNLDSLWSSWRNKSLPDTARLKALSAFCSYGQNSNADSAFAQAQTGYQFAKKRYMAFYEMKFLYYMAIASLQGGELETSETLTKRSMALADSLHNEMHYANCLHAIGNIYNTHSDYATSIDYYLRASNLAEKLNDQKLILKSNLGLGNAYLGLKEYDKSLYYFQKRLKIAETARDTAAISISLSSIGIAHQGTNNLSEALKFYVQGLQMAQKLHLEGLYGTSYMNIGEVYALMNEPALAIGNYKNAMREFQDKSNKIGQAQTLYRLAKVYKTQFPDSTLILGQRALAMARAADKKNLLSNIAPLLYETYEAQRQYEPALAMYKLHSQTEDSIYSQKQLQSIARSEAQYEYEKKQLQDRIAFEQELAQTRIAGQRRFFILLWVIAIIIGGGALYIYNRNVKYKAERAEALLKISQLRESVAKQTLSASGVGEKPMLDKEKIEAAVGSRLGETAWKILQLLAESPTISNHQIAESLFLSEEGISSSLRRMYSALGIQSGSSKNHKIALLTKAIELSTGD
ncbi:MAG: tetratricopeptide repeat protein [Saprospiraceae bacterium]|nr:tetratricopeptide repeat protein [Saprospiraceae bacterium]